MGPRPTRATSRLRGAQVARPRPGNKTRGSAERLDLKTMKTSGSEDLTGKGSWHAQPTATGWAWLVRSVANPERSEGGGTAPRRGIESMPRARSVANAGWAGGQERATTRHVLEAQRTGRAPSPLLGLLGAASKSHAGDASGRGRSPQDHGDRSRPRQQRGRSTGRRKGRPERGGARPRGPRNAGKGARRGGGPGRPGAERGGAPAAGGVAPGRWGGAKPHPSGREPEPRRICRGGPAANQRRASSGPAAGQLIAGCGHEPARERSLASDRFCACMRRR